MSRCRGPGSGTHAHGRDSHDRTTASDPLTGSGRSQARGCPATRTNPVIDAHGSPTRAVPAKRLCSQDRAAT